jgi:hypothetical protein
MTVSFSITFTRAGVAKAINAATIVIIVVLAAYAITNNVRNRLAIGLDDSDQDGFHRSGFVVQTDYKTGRQYLVTPQGGVTPRLAAEPH